MNHHSSTKRSVSPASSRATSHLLSPAAWALCLLLTLGFCASAAGAELELALQAEELTVSGVTAGGQVAIGWVTREPTGYYQRVGTYSAVHDDADHDGVVSIDWPSAPSMRAMVVAADVTSGRVGSLSMPRNVFATHALDPQAFDHNGLGQAIAVPLRSSQVVMLIVRAPSAAWAGQLYEGGSLDGDSVSDGVLHAASANLESLVPSVSTSPQAIESDDTVIIIDADRLQVFSTAGTSSTPSAGQGGT